MAVGVVHVFEVIDIHDDETERTLRGRILAKDRKVTVEFPGVRNVQSRIKPGLPRIRTSRVDGLASEWRDLHQRCILYRGGHACPHEDAGDLAFPFQSRNRAKPFLFSADEYCGGPPSIRPIEVGPESCRTVLLGFPLRGVRRTRSITPG